MFTHPGGRITGSNCTLEILIEEAFDVEEYQVTGGPRWIHEALFNIDAKPPSTAKSARSNPSSIKLPPNDEQRLMLRSLLADRFRLKWHVGEKEGPVYVLSKNGTELRLAPPKEPNGFPWVGNPGGGMIAGDGIAGENASMPLLARRLSRYVERPVLDRTGIVGSFDFRFDYVKGDQKPDVIATIFTSLQGIGSKMEPRRGGVKLVVIDSVEKLSEN